MELGLWLIGSYLLGSIPTSIVVSKLFFGCDIRHMGSGNAGATNVFRCLGWKPALFVAGFDVFKGWLPPFLAGVYAGFWSDSLSGHTAGAMVACGFAAVLGHTYTLFARFKGGKGVGTAAGMLLALFPWSVLICIAVFVSILVSTGMVSAASIGASIALPITLALFHWGFDIYIPLALRVFALLIPAFIVFTHRTNLGRIFRGTEHRFEKAMIFRRKHDGQRVADLSDERQSGRKSNSQSPCV